ncbi:MAG: aminotransferase class I/II-fold pyridoxal phosphate-dependent enzyme [Bacteroidia bacterium]|jgi:aspartate aminotransferase|nr:aminotransferase class I/II-fold pyridoxal phosphate-dependent enzyme [Bacteroidia bacterium]
MHALSQKIGSLQGSEIIRLAGEINQLIQSGKKIYNLTIGDFNPTLFPIPLAFEELIIEAYQQKQTNYPPADGTAEVKSAVLQFLATHEQLEYQSNEILIAGGGRPLIYAAYQSVLNPNDKVLYSVPSWNNNHYAHLSDSQKIEIETTAEDGFMPTAHSLEPYIKEARLLALCSPLNPTGTMFSKQALSDICTLVIAENERRKSIDQPLLYVIYDQIYWLINGEHNPHYNPVSISPEMKPYTLFIDGISKAFAATGVRVGWAFGPSEIINGMKSLLGHIGAWAPKPEQMATAKYLRHDKQVWTDIAALKKNLALRLNNLYSGFEGMRMDGLPVYCIAPQGAIYLSVQFSILGKTTPQGQLIKTTEDITAYLLHQAGIAVVPFTAFGCKPGTDWYRISIGTLHEQEIPLVLQQIKHALSALTE